MKKIQFIVLNVIIVSLITFSDVNAQSTVNDKESASIFVQKYYDWYSALYEADTPGSKGPYSQQIMMKKSGEYFNATLREALIYYYNTPLKDDDIGLDFDPFIAGQDSGAGYQAGNVKQVGNDFFVDVHNIEKGKPKKEILAAEVLVIVEVTKVNGNWKIVNFTYPPFNVKYDLLNMLKGLKQGSKK